MKRRLARAVCGLVAGLTLATVSACGDDTPPPTTTSTPPATSTPESPTPSADPSGQLPDFTKWQDEPADIPIPQLPEAATQKTKAGAIAFAKHYVDLFNYAVLTGDAAPAKELSPDCRSCKKSVADFARLLPIGGKYLGDPRYEFAGLGMVQFETYNVAVTLKMREHDRKVKAPRSKVLSLEAQDHTMVVQLSFVSGRWRVDDFSLGDI